MAMPTLICKNSQLSWSFGKSGKMTYIALVFQPAALLSDTEQIEGLASFQCRYLVQLGQRHSRRSVHEGFGSLHRAVITVNKGGRETRGYAQDAEQEEDADGAMIGPQTLGERLLRDETQLKIVPSELVDSLDDIWQWRQVVPRVDTLDVDVLGWDGDSGHNRGVQDISTQLGSVPFLSLVSPRPRVTIVTVIVWLAPDGEDACTGSVYTMGWTR